MARVTLKTVAEAVGVSPMTVSNAFSRPDQLSAALRARILAAAAELGYAGPDPAARSLARGATGTVGILRSRSSQYAFSDEHSTVFLAAIAEELGRTGVALTLLPPGTAGPVIPTRDVAMDGAIVYSCRPASEGVGWLRRRGLPRVLVDALPEEGVPSVNVDDRGGARAAARHLVGLGHRRIVVVALDDTEDPADFYPSRERMRGWQDVLGDAGIAPVVLRCADSSIESGAAAGKALLALPEQPTAVLCVSDAVAAGVLDVVQDAGVRVPEGLSVVGFDDTALAARTRPPLTTVHQDTPAKGRAVAAALVDAIAAARAGVTPVPAPNLLLPTELVVRDSTAAPSGSLRTT